MSNLEPLGPYRAPWAQEFSRAFSAKFELNLKLSGQFLAYDTAFVSNVPDVRPNCFWGMCLRAPSLCACTFVRARCVGAGAHAFLCLSIGMWR